MLGIIALKVRDLYVHSWDVVYCQCMLKQADTEERLTLKESVNIVS